MLSQNVPLCTDVDLLLWQPEVFREAAIASQVLLAGTGTLAGTAFTISAGSLSECHIARDHVITFAGAIAGCYPIVAVEGDAELTVSALYEGLFPGEGEEPRPSPIGSAAGLLYTVRTFDVQRRLISDIIRRSAGVESDADGVVLPSRALRRVCALGTLYLVYSAVAASAEAQFAVTAATYERLYSRALRQVRVEIDNDADGAADVVRRLSVLELSRR